MREDVIDQVRRKTLELVAQALDELECTDEAREACTSKATDLLDRVIAAVARGTVEMAANYALEPWEVEEGFVLACQSRPTTPELELDYDQK